jgi:regulatory protein
MTDPVFFQQVLKNAAVLCSKSEKCSADLIQGFRKSGLTNEEIVTAIEYLKKEKFIDDKRYAYHFVSDKLRLNKWGKVKIAYMLRQKHIDEHLIEDSLATIPEEDYEGTLRELLMSKAKSVKGISTYERKGKLAVFAQGRGFESDLAYRVASEIISPSPYK